MKDLRYSRRGAQSRMCLLNMIWFDYLLFLGCWDEEFLIILRKRWAGKLEIWFSTHSDCTFNSPELQHRAWDETIELPYTFIQRDSPADLHQSSRTPNQESHPNGGGMLRPSPKTPPNKNPPNMFALLSLQIYSADSWGHYTLSMTFTGFHDDQ